jgi:DNA-directed RNA polymerase subunit RPC12/RpoP
LDIAAHALRCAKPARRGYTGLSDTTDSFSSRQRRTRSAAQSPRVAATRACPTLQKGRVSFRYKDYADGNEQKVMTLTADEFLRRFTQHVLPKKFVKIRHYGLLANKQRQDKLELSRLLLNAEEAPQAPDPNTSPEAIIKEAEPVRCENCGSTRLVSRQLPRLRLRSVAIARLGRGDSG